MYTHTWCSYCLVAFRRSGCSQLTSLTVLFIPSRKWGTPHSTIRRKIKKSSKPLQNRFQCLSFSTHTSRPFLCWQKKLKRALPTQRCENYIRRVGSPVFASPMYWNLMRKYLRTAAKIRWRSFLSTSKIRTATSQAFCEMWNRWRL